MKNGHKKNGNGKSPFDVKQRSFSFDEPAVIRPVARATDPDTSWEAANSFTKKRLSAIQEDVLDQFRRHNTMTDEELEDALAWKYHAQTTVSKRRTDLVRLGYLRNTGEKTWNRNNRRMIRWGLKGGQNGKTE